MNKDEQKCFDELNEKRKTATDKMYSDFSMERNTDAIPGLNFTKCFGDESANMGNHPEIDLKNRTHFQLIELTEIQFSNN